MSNKDMNEQELRRQLKYETDKAVYLKDETWKSIQQELFSERKKKGVWKKRIGNSIGIVAAAAILFAILFSSEIFINETAEEPGVPNNYSGDEPEELLADMYEQEKEMEIELEGMTEDVVMELAVNEEERYVIYIEKEKYEYRQLNGEAEVRYIQEREDMYPPVAMFIKKQTDTTLEEQIQYVKDDIEKDGMILTKEDEIKQPFDAYTLKAYEVEVEEAQWDTGIHHYYITEVESGIFFLFKMTYFVGALDGYPNRFDLMLENFEYAGEERLHNE